jgi:hypothetical protein
VAHISKKENKIKPPTWKVMFRKMNRKTGKLDSFSATFYSEKRAKAFAKKWEPVYYFEGPEAIEYDKAYEMGLSSFAGWRKFAKRKKEEKEKEEREKNSLSPTKQKCNTSKRGSA